MVDFYSGTMTGPRGPGLSSSDTAALNAAVSDATAARTAAQTAATSAQGYAASILTKAPLYAPNNAALRRGLIDNVTAASANGNFTWTVASGVDGFFYQTLTPQIIAARDAGVAVTILSLIVSGTPTSATIYERNAANTIIATTAMLPLESGNPIVRGLVLQATTTNLLIQVKSTSGAVTLYRPSVSIGEPARPTVESTLRSVSGYRETVLNRVAPLALTNFATYSGGTVTATYSAGVFSVPPSQTQVQYLNFDFVMVDGQKGTCRFKINRNDFAGLSVTGRLVGAEGGSGDFGGNVATFEYVDETGLAEVHFTQGPLSTNTSFAMRGLRIGVYNTGGSAITIRDVVVSPGDAVPPMAEVPAVVALAIAAATGSAVANPVRLNTDKLRTWRSKLAQLNKANTNTPASPSLLIIGDSFSAAGGAIVPQLRRMLVAQYGDGGLGWIPFATTASAGYGADGRQAAAPGGRTGNASWIAGTSIVDIMAGTPGRGADGREITTYAVGDRFVVDLTNVTYAATIKLFFVSKSGGGSFQWRQYVGGGAGGSWTGPVSTDSGGADAIGSFTVTLPASGTGNKIEIETTGEGTSHVTWTGGDHRRTDAAGVVLHRIAHSSSSSAQWAALAAIWDAQIAAMLPDASYIMHSTNDQAAGRPTATQVANLTTIRNRIKAASPASDNMFVVPFDNVRGGSPTTRQYADAQRALALSLDDAWTDICEAAGPVAGYAPSSGKQWYIAGDVVHPATSGATAYTAYDFASATLFRSLAL